MDPLYEEFYVELDGTDYNIPDHLYHYTSLSTLALILENKALRFNRLDLVNDPNEARANIDNMNQLIFVSCWTAEKHDELSMWRMYSPHKQGVRIRLPNNPFLGRSFIHQYRSNLVVQDTSQRLITERKLTSYSTDTIHGPNKIEYVEDQENSLAKCLISNEKVNLFFANKAGLHKGNCWGFEKEWRYRIFGIQEAIFTDSNKKVIDQHTDLNSNPVITTYIDVKLDTTAFDDLEITLYPDPDPALRILVEALLHKHNINAPVIDSKLKVKW